MDTGSCFDSTIIPSAAFKIERANMSAPVCSCDIRNKWDGSDSEIKVTIMSATKLDRFQEIEFPPTISLSVEAKVTLFFAADSSDNGVNWGGVGLGLFMLGIGD